jgi:GNAT superfamily N-acetyltransferase
MNLTYEFIDGTTPNLAEKIGKRELTLLVKLLEELEHPDREKTKQAFGYAPTPEAWNNEALGQYLSKTLPDRMRSYTDNQGQGYSFFILRDESTGDPVALASGNIRPTHVRVLNFIVDEPYRKQGLGAVLMREILHKAAELDKQEVVVPLSDVAVKKGRVKDYNSIMHRLGSAEEIEEKPNPQHPEGTELHVPARIFKAIAQAQQSSGPDLPGN